MRRFWARFLALSSSVLLLLLLTACGGDDNTNTVGPPASVTLVPQPSVSLSPGDVLQMAVSVLDAQQRTVLNSPVTFSSSNPRIQIANSGAICAGTWLDGSGNPSLTSPIVCRPVGSLGGTNDPALDANGITANVTAAAGGITSNVVNAFVHLRVTSVRINLVSTPPAAGCLKQGETLQFNAEAFNGTTPITQSVGNINWQVLNGQVASAAPLTTLGKAGGSDPTTVTALRPGITQIIAIANSISPVNSTPATFTECPIARFDITPAPPINLSGPNATQQMTVAAIDTTGATVSNPAPTITWAANPTGAAIVNGAGLVTGQSPGTASVVAACIPAGCNIGLESVYSAVVPVTVAGDTSTTVYAASTTGSSLVPISTSNNTAGTALTFPNNMTPNSLRFGPNGSRAFLGSATGLIIIDATNNSLVGTVPAAPGKVVAVTPDSSQVIIADAAADLVRVFNNNGSTVTNFVADLDAASAAAAFSPDGSKAYIVSGSKLFVLTSTAISTLTLSGSASDVSFSADGNAAYVSDSNFTRVLTCNNSIATGPAAAADFLAAVPRGGLMLGASDTHIQAFDVTVTPASSSASACPTVAEPALISHAAPSTADPNQLIVTPDSSTAFVTSTDRTGSVLAYDMGADASAGVVSTIALSGSAGTTTGGVTLDSKKLYVGGTDNKVHVVDIVAGTETTTVDMGTMTPDLVAVRPR